MLLLQKASENLLTVTLKERQSLTSPYWLWVFKAETSNDLEAVILTDASIYKERYNRFTLTLPTDLDLTIEGDYEYWVYEQTSDSNLNPEAEGFSISECEYGKARLERTDVTEYFYE